jgi:hypothetical protein
MKSIERNKNSSQITAIKPPFNSNKKHSDSIISDMKKVISIL